MTALAFKAAGAAFGGWGYDPAVGFFSAARPSPVTPQKPAGVLTDTTGRRLLTTVEAAALLGLSPRTLEGLRRRGDGPPFKALGRNVVRYRADELQAWVDTRSAAHTAKARALLQPRT